MKALVLFDSNYGNTRKIAEAIAGELKTTAVSVEKAGKEDMKGVDLLVVGSPIIGWKPTEKMAAFLEGIGNGELTGVRAATFDTRVKLFIHGDGMGKIASALEKKGAKVISKMAFTVVGTEGPLLSGEIEKASQWGRTLIKEGE